MKDRLLEKTKEFVKEISKNETSGHDFWHVERVFQNARKINEKENKDLFLIGMIAYLHDLYDPKFFTGDPVKKLKETLEELDSEKVLTKEEKENIIFSCVNLGYSSNILEKKELSEEGKIVQDGDRLDAVGAIAIARTFTYSGKKGRIMYDPTLETQESTPEEYKESGSKSSIGHFYDKLLKVKEKMNTETAKQIAEGREQFVKIYMEQFFDEWYGRK